MPSQTIVFMKRNSRLSKGFSVASTFASCASTITKGNTNARGTKGNIVAVVCKRIATTTKPRIGPTDRPMFCACIVNATSTGPPVSSAYRRRSIPRSRSMPHLSDPTQMPPVSRLTTRVENHRTLSLLLHSLSCLQTIRGH